MNLYVVPTGRLAENTYFLVKENKDTLIFDPGDDAEKLIDLIDQNGLKPKAIALTHAHYDHIGAVEAIRQRYAIDLYVHYLEADFLEDPVKNLSSRHEEPFVYVKPAEHVLTHMGEADINGFICRLVHIPGHSPGSVAYIFEDEGFAIVGDTLFKGGCGRCDLPGSSTHQELMQGIEKHLLTLPDDTQIFAGHGESTTIRAEKLSNPYLNGVTR